MRTFLIACATAGLCLAQGAFAQDVENGARIAHTWCTNCHVVDSHDKGIKSDAAPPFTSVARQSGMTTTAIQVFLSTPHSKMPDFSLTRTEIRDVSAYIMSLKK
jgi:mono/diheme cytochrome c family protein